mgnify:CR=1 FL=1
MEKGKSFTQGVFVKKDYTQYGDEMISVSIKLEYFKENHITPKGYINFEIRKTKDGKYYAKNKVFIKDNYSEEWLPHVCGQGRLSNKYYK